jgi:DNA adenine methylase
MQQNKFLNMRYCGSKSKFVKELLPFLTENLNGENLFIDAFMGGGNVISEVDYEKKIGIEINPYIHALWEHIQHMENKGVHLFEYIPQSLSREQYEDIKNDYVNNNGKYSPWTIGYVGACCSYGSSWFNGYGGYGKRKNEDHIKESYNGLLKHINRFKYLDSTKFICSSYDEVQIPKGSVIYCDPPYANTKKYMTDFNHSDFWDWVRMMSLGGRYVYVSEYNAPSDFECIWEKKRKDSMGSSSIGIANDRIERLFKLKI